MTVIIDGSTGINAPEVTIPGVVFGNTRPVAQVVTFQTGAVATGSTLIPLDDTIPQITEGNEYLTLSITPQDVGSTLEIDVQLTISCSGANRIIAALFQDTAVNALTATQMYGGLGGRTIIIGFKHVMTAGSLVASIFRVRAGPDVASTLTLNGESGARLFGGVSASRITIKEYLP